MTITSFLADSSKPKAKQSAKNDKISFPADSHVWIATHGMDQQKRNVL